MIRSFRDRRTEAFYEGKRIKAFQSFSDQAEKRLQILDRATSLNDLRALHSNRLEALSGDRRGQFSGRINEQWRICFEWREDGPYEVEIVDYH